MSCGAVTKRAEDGGCRVVLAPRVMCFALPEHHDYDHEWLGPVVERCGHPESDHVEARDSGKLTGGVITRVIVCLQCDEGIDPHAYEEAESDSASTGGDDDAE